MTARNLHRIVGAAERLRANALAGGVTCTICPAASCGYIEAWDRPKPICRQHVEQAKRLGYTVVMDPES